MKHNRAQRSYTAAIRAACALLCAAAIVAAMGHDSARAQEPPEPGFADRVIASLTVDERVGQLVMVNFIGDNTSAASDVVALVRDFKVGAVLVTASNGNVVNQNDTPGRLARLANGLQEAAYASNRRDLPGGEYFVPLLIATDNEGDLFPYTNVTNGFTPLPNNMTIGATWSKAHAQAAGRVAGAELSASGINMLLGPVVDVLEDPRSGGDGDIGIRSLGGNAAWVGSLGRAFVRGVHEGSGGRMLTVAKHFPGHGASDRATDDEVPTLIRSLDQLRLVELAPFAELSREDAADATATTDAIMVSHIRYRNFAPSPTSPFTRPISIDAGAFRTLMDLPEFASWRANHLVMADALGVTAVKEWYAREEGQPEFPNRTVVRESLLAGNDLLPFVEFYKDIKDRDWKTKQLPLIQDSILYMREQYASDAEFRRRADEALRHVIGAKLRLYPSLTREQVLVDPVRASEVAGEAGDDMRALAEASLTLVHPPTIDELRSRVPRGPNDPDRVLIVECWNDCYPYRVMTRTALQDHLLRLYGPSGAGRLKPEAVSTISFGELYEWIRDPDADMHAATANAVRSASWIVFALSEYSPAARPASGAVKLFLERPPVDLKNKQLVAIAYNVPYHLDSTEISKLSAYFAVYNKTQPAIEASFRAMFGDVTPSGRSPVDIAGVFYFVDAATQAEPSQRITVSVFGQDADDVKDARTIGLVAGPIVDRNGNPVPDGTAVSFTLTKDTGIGANVQAGTTDGIAGAQVATSGTGAYTATVNVAGITSDALAITIRDAGAPEPAPSPAPATSGGNGNGPLVLALAIGIPTAVAVAVAGGGGALLYRRGSRRAVPALHAEEAGPAIPAALRVDADTRRVYVKGAEARPPLSSEQFKLLSYLYDRAGKVVPREDLVRHIWPDDHAEGVSEEALDALVRRVRERIVQAGGERGYIVTLRGQGFRLEA